MKTIDGARRRLLAPVLAVLTATVPVVSASDCKLVNAQFDGSNRICTESPVGICSSGRIRSGLLAGEFSARRDAVAPGAGLGGISPSTVAYSALAVVSTADGELRLRQIGVVDPDNRSFVELNEIVAGSGRFAGARGVLHVTGSHDTHEIATHYLGKISGRFCID